MCRVQNVHDAMRQISGIFWVLNICINSIPAFPVDKAIKSLCVALSFASLNKVKLSLYYLQMGMSLFSY